MVTASTSGAQRITPRDLDQARRRGGRIVVVDVRHRAAWASDPSRIPGAVWLPLEEVPRRSRDLPADAHIVVYCS
jgi:rhodanese-related sulfurtransferase